MRTRSLRPLLLPSSLVVLFSLAACSSADTAASNIGTGSDVDAGAPGPAGGDGAASSDDGAGKDVVADLVLEAPAEVLTRRGEVVSFGVKLEGATWSDSTLTLSGAPPGVMLEKTKDQVGSLTLGAEANAAVGDFELTLVAKSGDRTASRKIVITVGGPPGSLDTSFAQTGKVTFGSNNYAQSMIADASGRLLVLYHSHVMSHVARIKWDGALDESFDDDGITNVTFIPGASWQHARNFTLLDNGDIAVVGRAGEENALSNCIARLDPAGHRTGLDGDGRVCLDAVKGWHLMPLGAGLLVSGTLNGDAAAWKLTASGELDTTFGDGDGATAWINYSSEDGLRALPFGSGFLLPARGTNEFSLVRFDAKGDLMTSFGVEGRLAFPGHVLMSAMPGFGGRSFVTSRKSGSTFGLVLDATGKGDAGFGNSGVIDLTSFGDSSTLYSSDKPSELFVTVTLDGATSLLRIDPQGARDTTFGVNGATASMTADDVYGLVPLPRARVAVFTSSGELLRFWR